EDVLRIMRDHAVGSYGASALVLAIALKIAAIAALANSALAMPALLLAPMLGRWSAVASPAFAGYARSIDDDTPRSVGGPARFIGGTELVIAGAPWAAPAFALWSWRTAAALMACAAAAALWTVFCRSRIGGVTGDTLGAGVVGLECLVLVIFSANG